ncbi:MAG: hypothetical protein NZ954_01945 [Thermofilaceae archaeon]|nr:hypothetical protein [Thermofilaceae archaeon]MDW8003434.1 hypothetical protein [Thermofilaceae archaeon]
MSITPDAVIVEANRRRYELEWQDMAIILALSWVKLGALPLTRFQTIEPDYGKLKARIEKLKKMKLVNEVAASRISFIYLTDEGLIISEVLENRAKELNLL